MRPPNEFTLLFSEVLLSYLKTKKEKITKKQVSSSEVIGKGNLCFISVDTCSLCSLVIEIINYGDKE